MFLKFAYMHDYELKKEILEIPLSQQELVMNRFKKVRVSPERLLDWNEAKKNAKSLMKKDKV